MLYRGENCTIGTDTRDEYVFIVGKAREGKGRQVGILLLNRIIVGKKFNFLHFI